MIGGDRLLPLALAILDEEGLRVVAALESDRGDGFGIARVRSDWSWRTHCALRSQVSQQGGTHYLPMSQRVVKAESGAGAALTNAQEE